MVLGTGKPPGALHGLSLREKRPRGSGASIVAAASMPWPYVIHDGGRSRYFKTPGNGDCACRSVAIAEGADYLDIHHSLTAECIGSKYGPDNGEGVAPHILVRWLRKRGWTLTYIEDEKRFPFTPLVFPGGAHLILLYDHVTVVVDRVHYDRVNLNDMIQDGRASLVYGIFTRD